MESIASTVTISAKRIIQINFSAFVKYKTWGFYWFNFNCFYEKVNECWWEDNADAGASWRNIVVVETEYDWKIVGSLK